MPDKFDSGHVVIPVLHPSGDVHEISAHEDTTLDDLHTSLVNDYAPMPVKQPAQPTAEGSIEHSEPFRKTAFDAWQMADLGRKSGEAGTSFDSKGNPGKLAWNDSPRGERASVKITEPEDAMGSIHTHPNDRIDKPSDDDREIARRVHKTVFVVSRSGLWSVDPAGAVTQVFQSPGWMEKKKR
jgi:hypothetical protein